MSTYQITFNEWLLLKQPYTVDESFFTESNGYDEITRDRISRMAQGDEIYIPAHYQKVTCLLKD